MILPVLNTVTAYMALLGAILLCVVFVLRILQKKIPGLRDTIVSKANRALRRAHKPIAVITILFGIIHGLLSPEDILSLNVGSLLALVSILLLLTYIFRRALKKAWMTAHRMLALLFVIMLIWHVIDVGGLGSSLTWIPSGKTAQKAAQSYGEWQDGVYYGEADGYRPGLVVKVTVQEGRITEVEVVEHHEHNERYYALPIELIPKLIVEAQSTGVDAVSGATRTSDAIMEATQKALIDAEK